MIFALEQMRTHMKCFVSSLHLCGPAACACFSMMCISHQNTLTVFVNLQCEVYLHSCESVSLCLTVVLHLQFI